MRRRSVRHWKNCCRSPRRFGLTPPPALRTDLGELGLVANAVGCLWVASPVDVQGLVSSLPLLAFEILSAGGELLLSSPALIHRSSALASSRPTF